MTLEKSKEEGVYGRVRREEWKEKFNERFSIQ